MAYIKFTSYMPLSELPLEENKQYQLQGTFADVKTDAPSRKFRDDG